MSGEMPGRHWFGDFPSLSRTHQKQQLSGLLLLLSAQSRLVKNVSLYRRGGGEGKVVKVPPLPPLHYWRRAYHC